MTFGPPPEGPRPVYAMGPEERAAYMLEERRKRELPGPDARRSPFLPQPLCGRSAAAAYDVVVLDEVQRRRRELCRFAEAGAADREAALGRQIESEVQKVENAATRDADRSVPTIAVRLVSLRGAPRGDALTLKLSTHPDTVCDVPISRTDGNARWRGSTQLLAVPPLAAELLLTLARNADGETVGSAEVKLGSLDAVQAPRFVTIDQAQVVLAVWWHEDAAIEIGSEAGFTLEPPFPMDGVACDWWDDARAWNCHQCGAINTPEDPTCTICRSRNMALLNDLKAQNRRCLVPCGARRAMQNALANAGATAWDDGANTAEQRGEQQASALAQAQDERQRRLDAKDAAIAAQNAWHLRTIRGIKDGWQRRKQNSAAWAHKKRREIWVPDHEIEEALAKGRATGKWHSEELASTVAAELGQWNRIEEMEKLGVLHTYDERLD